MIHIGDDAKGGRVEITVHHTGVFGQTGVGKTKLLKYMMEQARAEGFSVLIFDSKVTGPEFEGMGAELPFYLEESTDPDVFRSLLEGMRTRGKGNMERYRGGFIEVCQDTKTFEEVGHNLKLKLADSKIRGYTKSMYSEIFYDYGRLIKLLEGENFAHIRSINFRQPVSRVPTYRLPNLALQGLVVRSMVEALLKTERKLIILVDEAPNFVNQKKYNPAKDALQLLDAQGRSKEIFGWYSGQTITGFDKANMKNLWYWIMGREMEKNEAKDVFDTQTSKALSVDQIKRMKVREFIVSTPDFAKVVMVPKLEDGYTPKHIPAYVSKPLPKQSLLPTELPTKLHTDESQSGEAAQKKAPALGVPTPHQNAPAPPGIPEPPSELNLEHEQMVVRVSHTEKLVSLSTKEKAGQLVYVLMNDREGQPSRASEIEALGQEHGWNLDHRHVSEIAQRAFGAVVFDGTTYRLARFVKVEVAT